jgi:hypothetical protein
MASAATIPHPHWDWGSPRRYRGRVDHQRNFASVERLDQRGRFSVAQIRIDNGGINRLTTKQGECIVSACGKSDDLTSCLVNHKVEVSRYERIVLDHEDASTIQGRHSIWSSCIVSSFHAPPIPERIGSASL